MKDGDIDAALIAEWYRRNTTGEAALPAKENA